MYDVIYKDWRKGAEDLTDLPTTVWTSDGLAAQNLPGRGPSWL